MSGTPEERPTGPTDLTADEWPRFKELWFAVESAPAAERERLLRDPRLSARLRAQVTSMLEAAARVGDRFERPAHVTLDGVAPLADAAPTLVGKRLGPFEVQRLIGRGGMGAVYEATRADAHYAQRVAIKTLWRGADSDVLLHRFRSERQILAALHHPNIAPLLDGGATADGTPWLAMEYVDGVAIDQYCDEHRLGLPARLDLFRQVCAAVHYAHQRLVVHRDLKPTNVLVTRDGVVKLLDFGVAKLLDDAAAVGTLTEAGLSPYTAAYAAPEQVTGDATTTATDVYSLGALLVTLLAGTPPVVIEGATPLARLTAVKDGVPRAPSVAARAIPDARVGGATHEVAAVRGFADRGRLAKALESELDAIALTALRRDPARRYASAEALSDDVRRYLRRDRVLARPDTVSYRLRSFARRQRALVVGTAAVTLAIIGGGTAALLQARAARIEAERAERASSFLAGIVTGYGATARDPIVRLGSGSTIASLLDSALLRVPKSFADDPRIRARLYTAIGTNLASQNRFAVAYRTLDSARVLSRDAYGARSTEYVAALLELAALAQRTEGPLASGPLLAEADVAMGRGSPDDLALLASAQVLRGQREMMLGHVRAADALADSALATETRIGHSTLIRARAELLRAHTSSWLRRDPREYVKRNRTVLAITDSLGALVSSERATAMEGLMDGLAALGRADDATQLFDAERRRLTELLGTEPLARARLASLEATVAALRGDTAAQAQALTRGWNDLQQAEGIVAMNGNRLLQSYIELLWSRGAFDDARTLAQQYDDQSRAAQSPLLMVNSALYLGIANQLAKDNEAAERVLDAGIATVGAAPDLSSMLPRLRRPLVQVLLAGGRTTEADSVRRLDPPKATVPRCTPGGEWRGCPDQ